MSTLLLHVERLPDELLHGGGPADVPAAPAGDAGLQSDQAVAAHQVAVPSSETNVKTKNVCVLNICLHWWILAGGTISSKQTGHSGTFRV